MTDTAPTPLDKPDLSKLVLDHGSHSTRAAGMCVMEAVAYVAGLPHSDEPECTDPVLTRVCIRLNDRWDRDSRQKLLAIVPSLVGTRGTLELSRRRAFFIVDRVIRSVLPAFLRELPGKPRPDLADRFEGLPALVDRKSAEQARDLARELRDEIRSSLPAYAAYAADAYAYASYAYASYAYDADAYAAAAAAAYADAYAAYAAAAAAAAASWKALRERTQDRTLQVVKDAIALTEATE